MLAAPFVCWIIHDLLPFGSHQTNGGGPEAAAFVFVVDTAVT
jgi:hypothetical protein